MALTADNIKFSYGPLEDGKPILEDGKQPLTITVTEADGNKTDYEGTVELDDSGNVTVTLEDKNFKATLAKAFKENNTLLAKFLESMNLETRPDNITLAVSGSNADPKTVQVPAPGTPGETSPVEKQPTEEPTGEPPEEPKDEAKRTGEEPEEEAAPDEATTGVEQQAGEPKPQLRSLFIYEPGHTTSGNAGAVKSLQQALGIHDDGLFGPQTTRVSEDFIRRYNEANRENPDKQINPEKITLEKFTALVKSDLGQSIVDKMEAERAAAAQENVEDYKLHYNEGVIKDPEGRNYYIDNDGCIFIRDFETNTRVYLHESELPWQVAELRDRFKNGDVPPETQQEQSSLSQTKDQYWTGAEVARYEDGYVFHEIYPGGEQYAAIVTPEGDTYFIDENGEIFQNSECGTERIYLTDSEVENCDRRVLELAKEWRDDKELPGLSERQQDGDAHIYNDKVVPHALRQEFACACDAETPLEQPCVPDPQEPSAPGVRPAAPSAY